MLFLLYRVGERRFALDARLIVEVLPLVDVRPLVRTIAGIAGTLQYRSRLIPVVDLNEAALGRPSSRHLGTRIIVARHLGRDRAERLIGLIAERATELARFAPDDFMPTGIATDDPYVGPITAASAGAVQRAELEQLIPAALRGDSGALRVSAR
jgi:chemotaxis-related protein WspB